MAEPTKPPGSAKSAPPSKSDELCEQAKTHLKNKDLAQATACYEQALALNSRHVTALEGMAMISFSAKEYAKAIELYKLASQANPRRVEPLVNLGAVLNRMENFDEAVRTLRNALLKDRRCAAAYYNLGIAYRGQDQSNMAISAYKEAIRLEPTMVDAYFNLGRTLADMGNASQAILNFEKALQLDPKFEKGVKALEKARDQKVEAKKMISPFGRLVNVNEIAGKDARVKFRNLSSQERFDDRTNVHKLAKEAELVAIVCCEQIKEELEPALLGVSRQMTNSEPDPHSFGSVLEAFDTAIKQFEINRQATKDKIGELRLHEQAMRK